MSTHASASSPGLRPVLGEWAGMLDENKPVHLADLTGREISTITRRLDKDDKCESFPFTDGLMVVRGLRKEQPGLLRAVIDYLTDAQHTTQTLDVGGRINGAIQAYAAAIDEAASLIAHGQARPEQVRRLRRQHALAIHATNKLIASMEAQIDRQGSR